MARAHTAGSSTCPCRRSRRSTASRSAAASSWRCPATSSSRGEGAVVGLPEVSVGVIPGGGGTQLLMRRVGWSRAAELIFTAPRLPRAEALELGCVDRWCRPARPATGRSSWPARSPPTRRSGCATPSGRCGSGPTSTSPPASRSRTRCWRATAFSGDRREGVAAFAEKRRPAWPGALEQAARAFSPSIEAHDPSTARRGRPGHLRAAGPRPAPGGLRGRGARGRAGRPRRRRGEPRPGASSTSACPTWTASRCAGGSAPRARAVPVLDPHRPRRRGGHRGRPRRRRRRLRHQAVPARRAARPGPGPAAAQRHRDAPSAHEPCASTPRRAAPGSRTRSCS